MKRLISIAIACLFLLSACGAKQVLEPTMEPTLTDTPTESSTSTTTSTLTPTPTITPSPTPTPPIIYPVPFGTPFPEPSEIITATNIDSLKQLSTIGLGSVNGIIWSPNLDFISISRATGAYLFDAHSMNLLLIVPDQADSWMNYLTPITAFSNDNQYFAVATTGGTFVYDLPSLHQKLFIQPNVTVSTISFFPDNESIAACLTDGTIDLYNIKDQELIESIGSAEEAHGRCNLLISSDGNTLAWQTTSLFHIWNLAQNLPVNDLNLGLFFASEISRDGSTLMGESENGNVFFPRTEIIDTKSGSKVAILPRENIASFSQSSDLIATILDKTKPMGYVCTDQIRVWSLSTRKLIRVLTGSEGYSITAFNQDGTLIAAVYGEEKCHNISQKQMQQKRIKVWNIETGELIGEYPSDISINNIAFTQDNKVISYAVDRKQIQLLRWNKYGEPPSVQSTNISDSQNISFSLDGVDINLEKLNQSEGQFSNPTLLSPDENYRLSWNQNKYSYDLLNNNDGSLIHSFGFWSLGAFSPKSDLLAIFTADHTYGETAWLEIWDLKNSKSLRSILVVGGSPTYLQFSQDERLLITGSTDQTVRIWGIENKSEITQYLIPTVIINPTLVPPWSMLPTPPLYDDFSGTELDANRWNFALGDSKFSEEITNGALRIKSNSPTEKRYLYFGLAGADRAINQITVFETKMKMNSSGTGTGYMTMQILTNISGITWQAQCVIEYDSNFFCDVSKYGPGTLVVEHNTGNMKIQPNKWHTVRIEMDPNTATIQFYLDGNLLDTYTPEDAQVLLKQNFNTRLGVSPDKGAIFQAYFDDVYITQR